MSTRQRSLPRRGRRHVLLTGVRALFVLPAAGALAACGKRVDCDDTSALAPAEREARDTQNYLAPSPDPDRYCSACKQYEAAADERACATCKVIKGPVKVSGSCKLFEKRA